MKYVIMSVTERNYVRQLLGIGLSRYFIIELNAAEVISKL